MLLLILQLAVKPKLFAQSPAIQSATQDGYQLSIESYHSTIESEANFSYSVSIQLPVGNIIHYSPQGITATLFYPANAQYVGINYNTPFGSSPGYTPIVNHANSTTPCDPTNPGWVTVHLNLPNPNLNTATLASFTVTVRVPSSHAVAGAAMNAHALLQYPDPQSSDIKAISTNNVTTQLLITNHWQVRKYAINTFHVGNGPLGTCNDAIVSHTIRYRVEIFLQNGADIKGSQDITLTSMRDFPVATGSGNLAGCTFGNIVNEFNMANLTGFGGTYGSFTIPAGAIVLQAANALNNTNHRFTFEMTLPANISNPSCIDNHINFTSVDFCGNAVLPPQSFHSFVEKRAVAPADVVVTKNVWQAGNTRGCPGFYSIRVMNRTNSNLSGFTLYDVMPDCMIPGLDLANVTIAPVSTTGTLGTFANCTTCFTQHTIGTFPTRTYKIFSNANILINEGQEIRIPFTIGNTCHDCFTNFVFDNDQHTQLVESEAESHSQICLLPDATIPCVRKSVCENKQYKIDGIIRFRLAIQNYGTVPMTGWTLKDDLKRVGLSYVGNESFYVATHRSAGGSTCLGFNPASYPTDVHKWSLTSPAPYNQPPAVTYINTASTREVSFQFTTFDLGCDGNTLHENNINNCIGAAGQNLPAFFIEFDAKVENDVGIGESMNISTLFDATSPTPVQHVLNPLAQAPFTVTDDINLTVKKEVSVDGGATFHTGGVTAQAGQTIQYKLTVDNTGLALQQPFLLDYLPSNSNDPGSSTPIIDKYLLANTTNTERGSNCDVFYRNAIPVGSTPGFTERFELSSPQPTDFNASDNFDLGSTGRQGLFQSQWSSTTPPDLQTKNFKVFYSVLPSGSTLTYKFDSEISSNSLTGQLACNTFAVRGRKKSMYNYQPQSNVLQLPAESPVVCVQVANPPVCCTPTFNIPQDICKNRATQFCVADGCECQPENMQNIYTWEFSDGTTYTGLDKCVSHAFPDARPYTISISWIDCNGQQQGPQVFYRDVMPCDECSAVNAMYTVTTSPTNSLTHTYDPTSSTTTGMQIIGYSWHLTETSGSNFVFNDITYPPTPQNSSANPNLTITFPGSGTYCMTLTLLMLDPDGNACKCNPSISECIEDGGALQDK